jgi:hypothetical protein
MDNKHILSKSPSPILQTSILYPNHSLGAGYKRETESTLSQNKTSCAHAIQMISGMGGGSSAEDLGVELWCSAGTDCEVGKLKAF